MFASLYITKSRIRRDILILFFTNPSAEYYLREIERILGYSPGSIRRELLKFQKDSLFSTRKAGNLLYYSLNTGHPLYQEIKNIIFKTIGVEGSLKKLLAGVEKIKMAFIYGSFASKSEKPASDIDVMIIGDPEVSLLNEKIRALELKLKREIHTTIYSLKEYQAKKREKAGFIMDSRKNPKIMLVGKEDDL
jgi:predicted nucleotidyltransferase